MKAAEIAVRKVLELKESGKGKKNYSIKAGAGGGKTTLLSKRICRQIIEGTPINEFVIITYTNAAAAELRDKLSDRLRDVIASISASDTEKKNAREALNSIELMQISTIHAFLLKLLREYAFETGIALDVKMLEDEEDKKRKTDFFNKWYDEHFDEIQKFRTDWTVVPESSKAERDVTRDVMLNMFMDIANVREDIVYDLTDHTPDFEKAATDFVATWLPSLRNYKQELVLNWPTNKDGSKKKIVKKAPNVVVENIGAVETKTAWGIDDAIKLAEVIGKIKESIDSGEPIYGKNTNAMALLGVTPVIPEFELEWNFEKLYSTFMLGSQKAVKVADYVCKMQKDYQKEVDEETLALSNDDKNDGDISKLSELMNDYIEKDIKREIPLESNENAVRLMNVHQSKGLTGQIVIIADRGQKEECRYSGFKRQGKYYPTVSYKSNPYGGATLVPTYGWDINTLKQAYTDETEEAIRLQYVAATRAAHALIIMPIVFGKTYPNAWFSDPKYNYDSLPDVKAWLTDRENDAKTYTLEADSAASSRKTLDLYKLEEHRAAADISKLTEKQLVSITPSGLEPNVVTGYSPLDAGYSKEDRPGRDVFGVVMHRVYELIFCRYEMLKVLGVSEREKAIAQIINQAILESDEKMHADDKPKEFFEYLKPKMVDYFDKVVTPIMDDAEDIYPEYTFSFYVDDTERKEFLDKFEPFFKDSKGEISVNDEALWVNGQADLVVKKKDGNIKVYDYKSDAMNGKPQVDFEASMDRKYEGQLALYRYAIGKAFGVADVQTELIHLYR